MTVEPPDAVEIRRRLRRRPGRRRPARARRYGLERLLYRLGRLQHANAFVLKGAMLFHLWSEELHRPTRDLDLLGSGESSVARLEGVFRKICAVEVKNDGLRFDAAAVRGAVIREGQHYEGMRIRFQALLGETRIPIHVDIGFGVAITPAAHTVEYPTLLDLPPPVVRVYPVETVVAEKYEAIVDLGSTNSRMKDFYDLWMLARTMAFDGETLSKAIRETFARRQTALPAEAPIGLTAAWAGDKQVADYWQGFLERSELHGKAPGLGTVLVGLREFLLPPIAALLAGASFAMWWPAGGSWRERAGDEGFPGQ